MTNSQRYVSLSTFALVAAWWVFVGSLMLNVESTIGDEHFYMNGSEALWSLIGLGPAPDMPLGQLRRLLVGRGWFMPGMSVVLTPIGLFEGGAPVARLYMGVVNFVLLLLATRSLTQTFNFAVGQIFFLATGLFPLTSFFAFTMWGDIPAALLLVIGLSRCFSLGTRIRQTLDIPSWREIAQLTGLLAITIYLRPNLALIAPVFVLIPIVPGLLELGWRRALRQFVPRLAAMSLGVFALVLPWSVLLSTSVGHPYLLTTSADLSWIIAFGDPEDVGEVGTFAQWHNHISEISRSQDISYGQSVDAERARIAASVTGEEYRDRARRNYRRYLTSEHAFLSKFHQTALESNSSPLFSERLMALTQRLNSLVWSLILLAATGAACLAAPTRYHWLNVAAKPTMLLSLVFPLIVSVHGRHIVDFVPIMVASASIGLVGVASLARSVLRQAVVTPASGVPA